MSLLRGCVQSLVKIVPQGMLCGKKRKRMTNSHGSGRASSAHWKALSFRQTPTGMCNKALLYVRWHYIEM